MFSRNSFLGFLLCLVVLVFGVACSEEPSQPSAPSFSGPSCLEQISPVLDLYLRAQAKQEDLNRFFDCLDQSVELFEAYTRGSQDGGYTVSDLRVFLKGLFQSYQVTDPFVKDILHLKAAVLGGSDEVLLREEFVKLKSVLGQLKSLSSRMLPWMGLFSLEPLRGKSESGYGPKQLEEAQALFSLVSKEFASLFSGDRKSFSLSSFERLVREFRIISRWEKRYEKTIPVSVWFEAVRSFKKMSVGGLEDSISASEWSPFFQSLSGWYFVVLRFNYDFQVRSVLHSEGLASLDQTFYRLFDLVSMSLGRQKKQTITYEMFSSLAYALEKIRFIPYGIRAISLVDLFEGMVERIFGDYQRPPGERRALGLSRYHLAGISAEYEKWSGVQGLLDRVYKSQDLGASNRESFSAQRMKQGASSISNPFDLVSIDHAFFSLSPEIVKNEPSSADLRLIMDKNRPLFKEGSPKIFLTQESQLEKHKVVHGFYSLSIANLLRGGASLVLKGYSWKPYQSSYLRNGLTEDELQSFYVEYRNFGKDIDLIDPRNTEAGRRAFMEGNIFTYSSDGLNSGVPLESFSVLNYLPDPENGYARRPGVSYGPSIESVSSQKGAMRLRREARPTLEAQSPDLQIKRLLNYSELVELLAFLFTGGELADDLFEASLSTCSPSEDDPRDLRGNPKFKRDCVLSLLVNRLQDFVPNMPSFSELYPTWPEEERVDFVKQLMKIAFSQKHSRREWIEMAEFSVLTTVLLYSEGIMTRYDNDLSNLIDAQELEEAFPTFDGFIRKFAFEQYGETLKRRESKIAFFYLVSYGEAPICTGQRLDGWWKEFRGAWDIQLDRRGLLDLFEIVMSSASEDGAGEKKLPAKVSCKKEPTPPSKKRPWGRKKWGY